MRYEHISEGAQIDFLGGTFTAENFNGSIVYGTLTDWDEGTTEERYTLEEIGHYAKELDGRNHRFVWDED